MSATTPVTGPRPAPPAVREGGRAPAVVVVAGGLLVGLLALLFNLRIKGFILDETVIKQSAVHYTRGLPHNLLHDVNARATSRLYSLVIAPLFALFYGDTGVRAARGLNGPLFASAVIPAYLLARQVLVSRWLSVAAGLTAVVLPWLTVTTAIFTENLAYPLVLWTVCAMTWAFRAPSLRRDLLVVALIGLATGTRTQLFALTFGYLALIVWRLWLDRPRDRSARVPWARAALGRFPVTAALVAIGVLVALALILRGTFDNRLRSLLGAYSVTTSDRKTLPTDVGTGVVVEILAIALGVGVVPALLAFAWWPRALAGRLGEGGRAVAAAVACAMVALFAFTIYSQGGFQGSITEERYFFYAAPFLWLGALAAVEARCVRRRDLLEAGLALALVAVVLPLPRALDMETSYFAPAMSATSFLLGKLISLVTDVTGRTGLSERDALGAVLLVLTVGVWLLWSHRPARAPAIALGLAGVLQLALLITCVLAIDGKLHGVVGRVNGPPFSEVGFIDRATDDAPVTWIDNHLHGTDESANALQRTALLYNDEIRQRVRLPADGLIADNFPLNSLPLADLTVGAGGRVAVGPGLAPLNLAVSQIDSPYLQFEGATLRREQTARLEVLRLAQPLRVRWLATGLDPYGFVSAGRPATLRAWGDWHLTLRLGTSTGTARVHLSLGGHGQTLTVGSKQAMVVAFDTCGDATGNLTVTGPAVQIGAVALSRGRCG